MYERQLDPERVKDARERWPWGTQDFDDMRRAQEAMKEREAMRRMTPDERRRHIAAHNEAERLGVD